MPLYFAYGSNLTSARMLERVPEARVVETGRLEGHRLVFDKIGRDGSAKANLAPVEGGWVWGVVYELPAARLAELDRVEGGYARIHVDIVTRGGRQLECETYRSELRDPSLIPHDWYVALVVDGAREHALPADWIEGLEIAARSS
jgi:gamma-glutamylcyclotransferase